MVTIVGKEPREVRRCTCRNCASIIEYTMNEPSIRIQSDHSGELEMVRELTCPGCGNPITVALYQT